MANVTIPGLPLAASIAVDTELEVCSTPAAVPTSQRITGQQILDFIATTGLAHLTLGGGTIVFNADGSAEFASGNISLEANGNATVQKLFVGSAGFNIDSNGVISGPLSGPGTVYSLDANGAATFASGKFTVDPNGNTTLDAAAILTVPGATTDPVFKTQTNGILLGGFLGATSGNYGINADGSAQFGSNGFTVDPTGIVNTNAVYSCQSVQVVGAQQPAIADAAVLLTDIVTKFNTLLAELRAHGLIAT